MDENVDFLTRQVNKGKKIVKTLLIINISILVVFQIMSIVSGLFSIMDLFSTIISIFIFAFIYSGSKTAKWIYIAFTSLGLFRSLVGMISSIQDGLINQVTSLGLFIIVILLLNNITTILILVFSESVNEFFYKQAN